MARIFFIKVYLTRPQFEMIKSTAEKKGFNTLSHYVRDVITGNPSYIEDKVTENNKMLKELLQRE